MKTINALIYVTMWFGGVLTGLLILWHVVFPWDPENARDPHLTPQKGSRDRSPSGWKDTQP